MWKSKYGYTYQEWHMIDAHDGSMAWREEYIPLGVREREDGTVVICYLIPDSSNQSIIGDNE